MSIIYALIAKEHNLVLSEASIATGNFPVITRDLLNKVQRKDGNLVYTYRDKNQFCITMDGKMLYLCLIETQYPRSRALEFLLDIKETFSQKYDQAKINESFSLSEFDETLKEKINYYNEHKNNEKIQQLKDTAISTVKVMDDNLQVLAERGDKIELLVKKTKELNNDTSQIKDRSRALKEKARNEQLKRNIIFGVIALGILYFLFL